MRKERPLRKSMQTEIQQQPNSEKTTRRRNEEIIEPNESSCESHEDIQHIKEIKKIEERNKHYTATVKINGIAKKFIIDTGSPISIMPLDKRIMKLTEIQKVTNRYQDVNKIEVKVRGKIPVNIEYESNKQKMEILITERTDITPLLGMDWMKTFKLTIGRIQSAENSQSEKDRIFHKFRDLFENNKTLKDTEKKFNLNRDTTQSNKKQDRCHYTYKKTSERN